MRDAFRLDGRLALITGGSQGIGRAIASCFVGQGARVVLTGRNRSKLALATEDLGTSAMYRTCDLRDPNALADVVTDVEASCGPIDTLVNNAGFNSRATLQGTSDNLLLRAFDTNVRGPLAMTRAVAEKMLERGHGDVQFVTSLTAYFGIPGSTAYTASKAALQGLVAELAVELGPNGIRVNGIAPGFIDTEMGRRQLAGDRTRLARLLERTPLGRLGAPEEVAWAAAFLASAAGQFISGTVVRVDGGAAIGF